MRLRHTERAMIGLEKLYASCELFSFNFLNQQYIVNFRNLISRRKAISWSCLRYECPWQIIRLEDLQVIMFILKK